MTLEEFWQKSSVPGKCALVLAALSLSIHVVLIVIGAIVPPVLIARLGRC